MNDERRQPPKKGADLGKWAEAEVTKWLEARAAKDYHFAWHRYPDARAARGALSAQPADFLVARRYVAGQVEIRRDVWHLEVKETALALKWRANATRIMQSLFSSSRIARKWAAANK